MVLTDFVCDIFMETQISHVKCFKQSLMISIKKKKKMGVVFGPKLGSKLLSISDSEMLLRRQKQA